MHYTLRFRSSGSSLNFRFSFTNGTRRIPNYYPALPFECASLWIPRNWIDIELISWTLLNHSRRRIGLLDEKKQRQEENAMSTMRLDKNMISNWCWQDDMVFVLHSSSFIQCCHSKVCRRPLCIYQENFIFRMSADIYTYYKSAYKVWIRPK